MKIKVTIQEEGMTPYEFHIDKESHSDEYPYQTFFRRPAHPGASQDFDTPANIGTWIGQWIKDYIERVEEEEK